MQSVYRMYSVLLFHNRHYQQRQQGRGHPFFFGRPTFLLPFGVYSYTHFGRYTLLFLTTIVPTYTTQSTIISIYFIFLHIIRNLKSISKMAEHAYSLLNRISPFGLQQFSRLRLFLYFYECVCMYVCMYVFMYVCMYICMYVFFILFIYQQHAPLPLVILHA